MSKKISENPTFEKLRTEIRNVQEFKKALKHFDPSGEEAGDVVNLLEPVSEFQLQLEKLAGTIDEFNSNYTDRGWVAYESMKFGVIESAVALATTGQLDEGEKVILDYYKPENLRQKLNFIKNVDELKPRIRLIELAFDDYCQGRFHACIPVLLMMIDGAVNDVNKHSGLFAENADVSAWDSIAGHQSGLGSLARILTQTRKKTSNEIITLPLRHGIIHGKELQYDNAAVAAKTWGLLFAVRDWIVAVRKSPPAQEPEKSIFESLAELKEIEKTNEKLAQWTPRNLIVGIHIPKKGNEADYYNGSPEQATVKFITLWKKGNYGGMAEMIMQLKTLRLTFKKVAGELREALKGVTFDDFEITKIVDQSPAVTEVFVNAALTCNSQAHTKKLTFRWIFMDENGDGLVRGRTGAKWRLIDNFHLEVVKLKME